MLRNTLNTVITATFIMLLGVSSTAQAIVPMGNLMGKTSVTWSDAPVTEIQHSIQSILVPAAPRLSGPDDLPSISGASLVSDDALQYTITSNANGVDTYTLTLTREIDGVDGGAFGFSGGFSGKETEVTLGATAAMEAADADTTEIKVPSDDGPANAVNGITANDSVLIGVSVYEVLSVADGDDKDTITLKTSLQAPVAFGDRIAEQETFEVTLDNVGTITEGAETGTVTITVAATSTSPEAPEIADKVVVINLLTPVGPSVEKYVRNVTPDNDRNPAEDNLETWVEQGFAYNDTPDDVVYFRSQLNDDDAREPNENQETKVKAKKDDILEYLIVLKAGNQRDQTGIILKEALSPFVTYVAKSAQLEGAPVGCQETRRHLSFVGHCTIIDAEGAALNITKNTSAHLTYKVTVMGGGQRQDSGKAPFPPGTRWIELQRTAGGGDWGAVELATTSQLQACYCGVEGVEYGEVPYIRPEYCASLGDGGGWVVGINGAESGDRSLQDSLIGWAVAGTTSDVVLERGQYWWAERMVCQ